MGGIVIDIWEKSNFFSPFGSQKGVKNAIFVRGGALKAPPLMVGLNETVRRIFFGLYPKQSQKTDIRPNNMSTYNRININAYFC